ncbi:Aste57867_24278 [Aphanomyces stellatus]|uniref:Aste57867_24278 protein n=1 Tax=Aphanomyces stellatus TaxID=120398 RepID=A0A485LQR2_9STRA|nr:hypothetical protein As57867_024203 [Aphanomyces stellatus]VFU00918.1 Aste57867_24278 [Aphanomyces stellatus]
MQPPVSISDIRKGYNGPSEVSGRCDSWGASFMHPNVAITASTSVHLRRRRTVPGLLIVSLTTSFHLRLCGVAYTTWLISRCTNMGWANLADHHGDIHLATGSSLLIGGGGAATVGKGVECEQKTPRTVGL